MGRNRWIADEEILLVAREMFLAGGMGVTTRHIAQALRISESVLYQRYGSKDALFYAAIAPPRESVDRVLRAVAELDDARRAPEAHQALVHVAYELVDLFRHLAPALVQALAHRPDRESPLGQWLREVPIHTVSRTLAERLRALGDRRILIVRDASATSEMLVAAAWYATHFTLLSQGRGAFQGEVNQTPAEVIVGQVWRGIAPASRDARDA